MKHLRGRTFVRVQGTTESWQVGIYIGSMGVHVVEG